MRSAVHLGDSGLVTVAELARMLGVSSDYVYRHADDLGVVRLGLGPKARLRFDPAIVAERLSALSSKESKKPKRHNPGAVRRAPVALLPIKGKVR